MVALTEWEDWWLIDSVASVSVLSSRNLRKHNMVSTKPFNSQPLLPMVVQFA